MKLDELHSLQLQGKLQASDQKWISDRTELWGRAANNRTGRWKRGAVFVHSEPKGVKTVFRNDTQAEALHVALGRRPRASPEVSSPVSFAKSAFS